MRGTAVVASAIGGPAEIVRDGDTGLLVPPGDVEALAAALERLACDRELAESMGARAHTFARARLGAGRFVDDWIGVYERLAARSAAERR